jgi:hypothetical protein
LFGNGYQRIGGRSAVVGQGPHEIADRRVWTGALCCVRCIQRSLKVRLGSTETHQYCFGHNLVSHLFSLLDVVFLPGLDALTVASYMSDQYGIDRRADRASASHRILGALQRRVGYRRFLSAPADALPDFNSSPY